MPTDIFEFWSQIGPKDRCHPADKEVFRRLGKGGHGFNLRGLPGCFMGPLRSAPVVLLYLSPGRGPDESFTPTKSDVDRAISRRLGNDPLVQKEEHEGAYKWWTSRTKCFGAPSTLSTKIATLNIGAYNAENFKDHGLLAALPSSRVSLSWAQEELFPAAERGERIVICLRATEYWGLQRGESYGKSLFAPEVTRGGHMHNTPMKTKIIAAVRQALN